MSQSNTEPQDLQISPEQTECKSEVTVQYNTEKKLIQIRFEMDGKPMGMIMSMDDALIVAKMLISSVNSIKYFSQEADRDFTKH